MRRAIFADIAEVESLRQIEIELHGTELPGTPDSILHNQINLGPVEGAITGIDLVFDAGALQRVFKRGLGHIPVLFTANAFWRTRAQIQFEGVKSERLEDVQTERQHSVDFSGHLIRPAKKVRVILRKAADSGQTVQHAAAL